MTKFVVDTNTLLDDLGFLEDKEIVILSHVLRELEKHKGNREKRDLAYKSRRAVRWIKDKKDNNLVHFDLKDYTWDLGDPYENTYVDNMIIKACLERGYGLITNDVLLQFKAEGFGIKMLESSESKVKDSLYQGFKEVKVETDEELASIYEDDTNMFGLLINEYLIIEFKGEYHCARWNGEFLVDIDLPSGKVVTPQNAHQACALDLLWDKDIPIKIITGTYGSGKTYLAVKTALEFVNSSNSRKKYGSLMVVRNPSGAGGEEIGFLPGSKEEKTSDFFKPIVQHLNNGEFELHNMTQTGRLKKEIPWFMKGLSINDTFILVDEAEDLDKKTIKLIGTRLGKNSCVVFSGDINQAEDKYVHNNGLVAAIEGLKGNPLVGIVCLQEDIRSEASKIFADL